MPQDCYFQVDSYPSAMTPGTNDVVVVVVAKTYFDATGAVSDQEWNGAFTGVVPGVLDEEVMSSQFVSTLDESSTRSKLIAAGFTEKHMC